MKIASRLSFFLLFQLMTLLAMSQDKNLSKSGLALEGYDPVSYFSGNPVKGKSSLAVKFDGAVYYFASEGNKTNFKKDPAKYAPAYGGYCAYAMGEKGEKVSIDPLTYKIKNGKLLLFYNKFLNNTLEDWNKNEPELLKKAELNWKKLNP